MQQPGGIQCTSWQLGGRRPTTQNCHGLRPGQHSKYLVVGVLQMSNDVSTTLLPATTPDGWDILCFSS
jgi:hypothetical protein